MERLKEHIRYAAAHGVLDEVDAFLRGLVAEDWLCEKQDNDGRKLSS